MKRFWLEEVPKLKHKYLWTGPNCPKELIACKFGRKPWETSRNGASFQVAKALLEHDRKNKGHFREVSVADTFLIFL